MNLDEMIKSLKSDKEALDAAILVLERLAYSGQRRRGRPPAWLQVSQLMEEVPAKPAKKRARKPFSEETKRRMAEAQKKRWASRKKEKG
jgi:hypothetical protein